MGKNDLIPWFCPDSSPLRSFLNTFTWSLVCNPLKIVGMSEYCRVIIKVHSGECSGENDGLGMAISY